METREDEIGKLLSIIEEKDREIERLKHVCSYFFPSISLLK